ncbi:hypothetical protein A2774_05215 [Candidatus Roizmanbacteria bacterium RIFCSPHIGHO2_01_FULL_39_12c]|uniref:VOC domain-containing protein n=1 Tax=Candidatus Roizmanbacteria bacterium RIFCSPHIGHO2_01_FULL_39_12c TaxID=1802031 RepID=A0A1F7GBK8_9BACT|nr:MAG: hypothetical protein A2774_05215 [Candidatus Roizmanbacteria bacterium RIFCSPHIGHO2_01_FULL_39_12c]OGK47908.1 MAG: hypothetical protein A2963_03595 [Candidatus Roizmanbacteria bacterium RIFCSPLOWO2_01_FULL_40_13]
MSNNKIEWIIIVTEKYQESRKFYRDILDFKIVRESVNEEFTQFKLGNLYFATYGRKQVEKLVGKKYLSNVGSTIFTFAETDNIDKQYDELKTKGVRFIIPPTTQPWGQRTAYFLDPDGYIWEIQQWVKKT